MVTSIDGSKSVKKETCSNPVGLSYIEFCKPLYSIGPCKQAEIGAF
jgi:hypothetical protein